MRSGVRTDAGAFFFEGMISDLDQALQLYALSTGSWWMGALSMLCFSLGTVPLMLGFGLLGGRLNVRFAKPMRLASGALILVMGTAMLLNSAALDLRVPLRPGDNVVEFTADEPGVIPYTCWMGMLRGSITVEQ